MTLAQQKTTLPVGDASWMASAATPAIDILTFSTLFPHQGRPNHGIFVENRLQHLLATGLVRSTVVAPVPWFPSRSPRFGDWAKNAHAARFEERGRLTIHRPRYLLPPRIGMQVAPAALFTAGALALRRLLAAGGHFDLIDAHYVYPDGVAAVALGITFGKPVVLTARGSDITQYPEFIGPRRMVQWAMRQSSALISVSAGLKDAMVALGAPADKVTVLRNGVDLSLFKPTPSSFRAERGITGPLLMSVGHLIERKAHHHAIAAVSKLPGWTLALVGEGPEGDRLRTLARDLGIYDRVLFCGSHPHSALPALYSAADVLILASSREGWANVLLEAMACGTPVVASNIPGNPEVVAAPAAGIVVRENTADCFAEAVRDLHGRSQPRAETRNYAEGFSWDATSAGQIQVFRNVLKKQSDDQSGSVTPQSSARTRLDLADNS